MKLAAGLAVAGAVHAAVNARRFRRPQGGRPARVSVLIPARDEAATIGACLATVRDQDIVEVLVLDDGSADATAAVSAAAGARVVPGTLPPVGWLGKPFACAQLADAADPASDVLVFLDADVRLATGAITAAVGLLHDLDVELLSPFPRQITGSGAERLVQPLLAWTLLTFLPLRLAETARAPSLVAANGQFLVVRRAAYARAGGHVPDAVLDDLALARAIKRSGGRVAAVDGSQLAWCRMYAGWPALRDGYSKSLWSAFGPPPAAAAVVAGLGYVWVWPAIAALRGSRLGAIGYAAGVASRLLIARRAGDRSWPDALAHPVSVGVLGYLTVRSHVLHRRGALRWKGRPVG